MPLVAEPVSLPFESGPLPVPRCGVCGGQVVRVHPLGERFTYAMRRQRWVKIGMSGNPVQRQSVLARCSPGCLVVHPPGMVWSSPIRLLTVVAGDIEHELHERFRSCHVAGEWFLPDAELRAWIRRTSRRGPVA